MNSRENANNNLSLLHQYRCGDKRAREKLIQANLPLVKSIASRFTFYKYETEDLISIGTIGLLKAIDGFDESLGYSFSTYAFPLIIGEIKRFLRDDGIIKISRKVKKNAKVILSAKEEFIKANGKEPRISDLSEISGLSIEETTEALEAASPIISLEDKITFSNGEATIADTISDIDRISEFTDRFAIKEIISSLPEFESNLINLRYFKNMTQTETARLLGISQVTVSRCEKKILEKMKAEIC